MEKKKQEKKRVENFTFSERTILLLHDAFFGKLQARSAERTTRRVFVVPRDVPVLFVSSDARLRVLRYYAARIINARAYGLHGLPPGRECKLRESSYNTVMAAFRFRQF